MPLGREIERLGRVPVFACLDAEALRLVAFSAEARDMSAGQVLFRRGESAEAAVLLASGTLTIEGEGRPPCRARAGTLLGETALFAPGLRVATATANEACTVVTVRRALMARVLDAYPHNALALRRYWADRLGERLQPVRLSLKRSFNSSL